MSTLLTDMTDEELNVTLNQLFPSNPPPKRNRNRRRFGAPPPKRRHTSIQPKKPYIPITEPITATETVTIQETITATEAIAQPIPTLITTSPSSVADPFAYVMDGFDNFIAPGIVAESKSLVAIRRGLYRRAVAEFATDEIKAMSALRSITVEDILTIILSSVHKSGLILV